MNIKQRVCEDKKAFACLQNSWTILYRRPWREQSRTLSVSSRCSHGNAELQARAPNSSKNNRHEFLKKRKSDEWKNSPHVNRWGTSSTFMCQVSLVCTIPIVKRLNKPLAWIIVRLQIFKFQQRYREITCLQQKRPVLRTEIVISPITSYSFRGWLRGLFPIRVTGTLGWGSSCAKQDNTNTEETRTFDPKFLEFDRTKPVHDWASAIGSFWTIMIRKRGGP